MWKLPYSELRKRGLIGVSEESYNSEMELAELEERLMPKKKDESRCVVGTTRYFEGDDLGIFEDMINKAAFPKNDKNYE